MLLSCFILSEPNCQLKSQIKSSQQRSALTETQRHRGMMAATCVTHWSLNLAPGLPSTTTLQSRSKGLISSTEIQTETEQKTLMCASQTSFQLLPTRCSLGVLSLATLLDLALMGNISSSQVRLFNHCQLVIPDQYSRSSRVW